MEIFYFIAFLAIITGFVVASRLHYNVTFFAIPVAIAFLLSLAPFPIIYSVEKEQNTTFHEFWNGVEVAAEMGVVECVRDGSCVNTFQCDPYIHTYTEYYTDSEGNMKSRMKSETRYHSCPYSTEETSYFVNTTLGAFTIAKSLMTGPEWRAGHPIPGGQVTSPPQPWEDARIRIAAGAPLGASVQKEYKNHILAADSDIYEKFSPSAERYVEEGLLRHRHTNVYDGYKVDKVSFFGVGAESIPAHVQQELRDSTSRLAGRFGIILQGDLNVVFVDSSQVKDPNDYEFALHAHWMDPSLGRDRLPKNTMNVVFGVKDGTVEWSRAFAGMPLGNEALIRELSEDFVGLPVDADLIGSPKLSVADSAWNDTDSGALQVLLFGENKFERVSMDADEADDVGTGYGYLTENYEASPGAMVGAHVTSGIIIAIGLAVGFALAYSNRRDSDFLHDVSLKVLSKFKK